jgi:hypothetical protein
MMPFENNVRKAKVIRVVNNNTLDLEIKLGFGVVLNARVDLARIAPDNLKSEAAAFMQIHFIKSQVPEVVIKFDRHPNDASRYLVEVWDDMGGNLNDFLMLKDLATLDEGLKLRDIPTT